MIQTVTLDIKLAKDLEEAFRDLSKEIVHLRKSIKEIPAYGSEDWWELSDARAARSILAAKGTRIRNKKELVKFFDEL